jgi:hypothetical protein
MLHITQIFNKYLTNWSACMARYGSHIWVFFFIIYIYILAKVDPRTIRPFHVNFVKICDIFKIIHKILRVNTKKQLNNATFLTILF